jgi:Na+-translocating ferredoxin:NAD+ oxidoreductase RnfG subunit
MNPSNQKLKGVAIPVRWLFVLTASTATVLSHAFGGWTQREQQQTETLLSSTFTAATHVVPVALPLTQSEHDSIRLVMKQRFDADTLHLLIAVTRERIAGYAVIDQTKGKDQLITYAVVVDEKLSVKGIEILAYREPYGGEVQNQSWLRQFLGKQPEDTLRPGRDIKNITGATISARSVTLGVKKILSLLRLVQPRLPQTTGVGQ